MDTNDSASLAVHPADHALNLKVDEKENVKDGDVERDARRQGWVPKEQFRGDESDWVDADTFAQRGREINPILRANNERLKNQIDSLSNQNFVLVQELTDLKKGQIVIQQRDYDTTLKMLKSARLEAIEGGDNEKFLGIDEQIDQLRSQRDQLVPQIKETPQKSSVPDPEFQAWHIENPWYGVDEWRTITVNKVAEETRSKYPDLVGRGFLDEVILEAQSRYPKDFYLVAKEHTPDATRHSMVNDFNGRRGMSYDSNRNRNVGDLPADAREAMKKFVKDGLMTEKRYIELYFLGGGQ